MKAFVRATLIGAATLGLVACQEPDEPFNQEAADALSQETGALTNTFMFKVREICPEASASAAKGLLGISSSEASSGLYGILRSLKDYDDVRATYAYYQYQDRDGVNRTSGSEDAMQAAIATLETLAKDGFVVTSHTINPEDSELEYAPVRIAVNEQGQKEISVGLTYDYWGNPDFSGLSAELWQGLVQDVQQGAFSAPGQYTVHTEPAIEGTIITRLQNDNVAEISTGWGKTLNVPAPNCLR